ncbi:MAG: hypothetical protein ACXADW_10520 [Candidatus Hodarchaeales archaeon]
MKKMDKKLRIRETKDTAQVLLWKMLPLLLMVLLFMFTSTVGGQPEGAMGSGID